MRDTPNETRTNGRILGVKALFQSAIGTYTLFCHKNWRATFAGRTRNDRVRKIRTFAETTTTSLDTSFEIIRSILKGDIMTITVIIIVIIIIIIVIIYLLGARIIYKI